MLAVPFSEFAVYRGLRTPDLYAYGVLEGAAHPSDGDLHRFAGMARQLPAFATSAPAIDRLESVFTATNTSTNTKIGRAHV